MRKKFFSSGIYNKRTYYFKFALLAFLNMPIVVHVMLGVTFISVVLIEFLTDASTRLPILNIVNNLSYNTLAGCIFYLIINHIPQEYKKIKLHVFINNKTASLLVQVDNLFKTLIEYHHFCQNAEFLTWQERDEIYKNLTEAEIDTLTSQTSPFKPVTSQIESKSFENWIEYWNWKVINIKKGVNGLAPYNELFSPDFLKYLTWTESSFDNMEHTINHFNNPNNNTLHLFTYHLQGLWRDKKKLSKTLRKDFGVLPFRLNSFEFARDNKEQAY